MPEASLSDVLKELLTERGSAAPRTSARDALDEWLTEEEMAAALHKSVRTLRKWRHRRVGPPYTHFGRTVKYRATAVVEHYRQSEVIPVRQRTGQSVR